MLIGWYRYAFFEGLSKKLDVVANSKKCKDMRSWVHSIINHLYWSAATSQNGDEMVAKWVSVVNHIQDIHIHDDQLFPACQHDPIDDSQHKNWLEAGIIACIFGTQCDNVAF